MYKEIEILANDQMVNLTNEGYTFIYYNCDSIWYENMNEQKKYPVFNNGKKQDSLYLILTISNKLLRTQNLKHYSKNIKSMKIECVLDYNDELDDKQKSYYFNLFLPEIYMKRMKKTFLDVTTEVIIFKEEDIKKYMEEEDYLI
jgi:hypothetical protein